MSKGSKITVVRLGPSLDAAVDAAIARRNGVTRGEPWDRSAFVRYAVEQQLGKMRRSRVSRRHPVPRPCSAPQASLAGPQGQG